jgi:hypothetical protein
MTGRLKLGCTLRYSYDAVCGRGNSSNEEWMAPFEFINTLKDEALEALF